MQESIAIRRSLEPWFEKQYNSTIKKLTIILRVDGSLGSFGSSGVENIKLCDNKIECDLVISDYGWDSLSSERVSTILKDQVLRAINHCFEKFGFKYDPIKLEKF